MDERERLIIRQVAIKAAAEIVGRRPESTVAAEIPGFVLELAETFNEWICQPTHEQAVANVRSGFAPAPSSVSVQAPPSASNGASVIPSVCPKCGCKVRDNRAANIKRSDEGKPALPELKCGGKVHRVGNAWITDQEPCNWVVWEVEDLQTVGAAADPDLDPPF